VYGIDFADEEGPSLFGQSGPEDEPGWVTGLSLLPDGMDLTAEEAFDNWRRTPDHLRSAGLHGQPSDGRSSRLLRGHQHHDNQLIDNALNDDSLG
jgi:hypothetical protein